MPEFDPVRSGRILDELQDAVSRLHVISIEPRIVVAAADRKSGPRPMAWQVLFQRSFGSETPAIRYRGASATNLNVILERGFDDDPSLDKHWSHERLRDAMKQGPVIQAFREDRLPDDVENALIGLLIFEEDGLNVEGIRTLSLQMSRTSS